MTVLKQFKLTTMCEKQMFVVRHYACRKHIHYFIDGLYMTYTIISDGQFNKIVFLASGLVFVLAIYLTRCLLLADHKQSLSISLIVLQIQENPFWRSQVGAYFCLSFDQSVTLNV